MAKKKLDNSDDQALIQKERDYISGADVTPISMYAYKNVYMLTATVTEIQS